MNSRHWLASRADGDFPTGAGLVFGAGIGGFFDGIVLHQLLQWHHMLSSWYPPTSLENLRLNTLWDGIFHSGTYVLVVLSLYRFGRVASAGRLYWSGRFVAGSVLAGWGLFNVLEGLIDHQLLGVHHVNEVVDAGQRWAWDLGFLVWGGLMLAGGWWLLRTARRERQAMAGARR